MIGLDIGARSIKVVEIEKDSNVFKLRASGIIGYKGNSPENITDEKELAGLAQIVKKIIKDTGISGKNIAISLPEPQVFTRIIRFPMLTEQEIASAVKWEAEQYIPIPISEAVVQHQIIERNDKATPQEVVVLLVATPKIVSQRYLDLSIMAQLNAEFVESQLIALVRVLAPSNKTAVILDGGALSTSIGIAKNQMLSFSRSVPIGGDTFTRAISQNLGLSIQQAEEYKKAYGLLADQLEGKVKNALSPMVQMVADEVKKAVHFYQSEENGDYPSLLVATGGCALMPNYISTLSSILGLECVMANPFEKIQLNPDAARSMTSFLPLYSVAVGLAFRS